MYLAEQGAQSEVYGKLDEASFASFMRERFDVSHPMAIAYFRQEKAAFEKAANKADHVRRRAAYLKTAQAKALRDVEALRERALKMEDKKKRGEVLRKLDVEADRLRGAGEIIAQMKKHGLGVWFIPIMGLITAGATVWLFFENKDKLGDMIGKSADAVVVMAYTAAVGVGIFGLLYFARIARDIWEPKGGTRETRYVPQRS